MNAARKGKLGPFGYLTFHSVAPYSLAGFQDGWEWCSLSFLVLPCSVVEPCPPPHDVLLRGFVAVRLLQQYFCWLFETQHFIIPNFKFVMVKSIICELQNVSPLTNIFLVNNPYFPIPLCALLRFFN